MPVPRKKNKNPPVMSHEFVIQNHADILACIAIVIVMGLMSQKTASLSKVFVFLQYGIKNDTDTESEIELPSNEFERGLWDIFTVIFASLMVAVFHAVVQEYGIDKYSKRLHLSKIKTSKFNESGHLVVWCFISAVWGIHDLYHGGFHKNVNFLWKDYPHTVLKWESKLYFISQLGYWLHLYPELYFLRAKREEIPARIQYYTLHLLFIAGAYTLHFWRLAVVLLTIHYIAEGLFHASRLLYYAEMKDRSDLGFTFWRFAFIAARLFIILLGAVTFIYGLPGLENRGLNTAEGNFNSFFIRISALASVVLSQFWLLYLFFGLLLRRAKEEEQEKEAAEKVKQVAAAASEVPAKRTPKATKRAKGEGGANGVSTRSGYKAKKN